MYSEYEELYPTYIVSLVKEVCWSEPPVINEKSQWLNKDKYISFPGRESSAPTCRIDRNA